MTDDIISSDHPFTRSQRETLTALLDTLLPASEDGTMPSAGEFDFVRYLNDSAPEFLPVLEQVLSAFDESFASLALPERHEHVKRFSEEQEQLFTPLLVQTYAMYYQQARVLEGIGLAAGPPFPRGNTVEAGDLSLLDRVVARPRSYRKV